MLWNLSGYGPACTLLETPSFSIKSNTWFADEATNLLLLHTGWRKENQNNSSQFTSWVIAEIFHGLVCPDFIALTIIQGSPSTLISTHPLMTVSSYTIQLNQSLCLVFSSVPATKAQITKGWTLISLKVPPAQADPGLPSADQLKLSFMPLVWGISNHFRFLRRVLLKIIIGVTSIRPFD